MRYILIDMRADEILRKNLQKLLKGAKQLAVAEAAGRAGRGITQSYISAILRGRDSNPSLEKLEAIASGLNVPIAELFKVSNQAASQVDPEEAKETLRKLKIVFAQSHHSEKILKAAIEAAYQEVMKK
jgi:transcriptional regulator with XRE-family HTH domain